MPGEVAMYSRHLLNTYIEQRLVQKKSNMHQLAKALGVPHSNLSRALNSEKHHLTLAQFSVIVRELELTPEQTVHILTGQEAKKASAQLSYSAVENVLKSLRFTE